MTVPRGRSFYKMSGSGNDFIVVDSRGDVPGRLEEAGVIRDVCARGTGVGADGIVFLEPSDHAAVKLVYFNADGSRAELCGNATLCTTRLSVELGLAKPDGFSIETDSGLISARISGDLPEIDLQPVTEVVADYTAIARVGGEDRIGFAVVGVPHLVVLCTNVAEVDVAQRGRALRTHRSLVNGANVNFVSPRDGFWSVRTYERGVEGETLACGSGAVATAILLVAWGLANPPVELETASRRRLRVRLNRRNTQWNGSLQGEAKLVFTGHLGEL